MENKIDFDFDEVEVFPENDNVVVLFKNRTNEVIRVKFDPTNRKKIFKMMLQAHRRTNKWRNILSPTTEAIESTKETE